MSDINNKKVLLSTAYLPPLEYFYFINRFNEILIESCETYPKQTYRNRCSIMTANGELDLIIPVKKPNGNNTKTFDIIIDNSQKWQSLHWRAIESAYSKAPYYIFYKELIQPYFFNIFNGLLIDWNALLLRDIQEELEITSEVKFTDRFEVNPENTFDLRYKITPKNESSLTIRTFPEYMQVFGERFDFHSNLSILDLLFCLGPGSRNYLSSLKSI